MKLVNFTNDITTIPEGKEESVSANAKFVDLTSMILLFIGKHHIEDDTEGERSSRQFIKLIYAAYDNKENMYLLVQYYAYEHEDEKDFEAMQKCKYFDGSFSNDQLVTTINFFTGSMVPYTVDCINTLNEETNRYEFYGVRDTTVENEVDCIKFSIPEKIKLGIEMIYKMIGNNQAIDGCIVDANVWMYNDEDEESDSYRNIYREFTAKSFEIRDISRSTKKARGIYVGIVAIEFFCEGENNGSGTIYTAILPYRRSEKLRRRDLTMDMALMQTKYENGYVVGSYSACPIEADNSTRKLIAYCQKFKRFIIIDFTTEKYNEFIDMIEKIGE